MNKWQKINLICFSVLIFFTTTLVYVLSSIEISNPFVKPWHLLPSVHEDSLSQGYLADYKILNKKSLIRQFYDSSRTNVFILVDAWGVPIQESVLKEEFDFFEKAPHEFALHQRLANHTKHADLEEFRNDVLNNVYLFGGDSLEYGRSGYVREMGFNRMRFCQKCEDKVMIAEIDSLLENDSLQFIAWTSQSSRSGDKDSLHKSLKLIADFAERHPDVQIIVQGAHRPVLCGPEVRNSYKSHWVPVVILNRKK